MARATSIGRLSASPPSTSNRPSRSTGANTPGGRHAGAHRRGQVTSAHDYCGAGLQIGGDGAKRCRQVIEVRDAGDRQRESAQVSVSCLALHQALGISSCLPCRPSGRLTRKFAGPLPCAGTQIGARRSVAKRVLPVDRGHGTARFARPTCRSHTARRRRRPCWCRRCTSMGTCSRSSTLSTPMCARRARRRRRARGRSAAFRRALQRGISCVQGSESW